MNKGRKNGLLVLEICLIAICLLMFYPVIMMVIVSLKDDALLAAEPLSLKTSFAFGNYITAVKGMNYGRALYNSTVLTVTSGLLTTFFGACAALRDHACAQGETDLPDLKRAVPSGAGASAAGGDGARWYCGCRSWAWEIRSAVWILAFIDASFLRGVLFQRVCQFRAGVSGGGGVYRRSQPDADIYEGDSAAVKTADGDPSDRHRPQGME